MILYSLQKEKYKDTWPIRGSLFAEGRWNKAGQWIIYTSSTLSLAKLEILANSPVFPTDMILFEIEVEKDATVLEVTLEELASDWDKIPYPKALHDITEKFIEEEKALLMQVPSVHSNREYNYLINPAHPKFNKLVSIKSKSSAVFDSRLK